MPALHVNESDFSEQVMGHDGRVLVDFWAQWCGPCRVIGPLVDALADERDDVKVVKVDIDANPALAQAMGVKSIPTLLVFDSGQVAAKHVGSLSKGQLSDLVSQ